MGKMSHFLISRDFGSERGKDSRKAKKNDYLMILLF